MKEKKGESSGKSKKTFIRVILYASLILLCVLVFLYYRQIEEAKEPVVSKREQYQYQMKHKDD